MMVIGFIIFLLGILCFDPANAAKGWQTLNGTAPLIIANGGTSGLYPDQTFPAYSDALNYSLPGVAFSCDLQLTNDIHGICRTGLDLGNSTNIASSALLNGSNTYTVNGKNITGWFAIDFNLSDVVSNAIPIQRFSYRTNLYDNRYFMLRLEQFFQIVNQTGISGETWLNVEYSEFYMQHNVNITDYLISAIVFFHPNYISSPEIKILKSLKSAAKQAGTKLIFKFREKAENEPTTNVSYGSLLGNFTNIAAFASGILIPKDYVWPVDPSTLYILPHTSLVQDAHKAKLAVYAYDFYNDIYPNPYNYSFDPIKEYLNFIDNSDFSVDGVFSDFPTTASESISCFSSSSGGIQINLESSAIPLKTTVISHNGDSGNYPGCTTLAYDSAVNAGVDYIDCSVQMTKDGVPICREAADLTMSTDVSSTPFLSTNSATYPDVQATSGVFSFDLTWSQINASLTAVMHSPEQASKVYRNKAYDGQPILTLAEFLDYAKKLPKVGIVLDIQNAYFLRTVKNLSAVDAVVSALSTAGFNSSSKVILESSDSSALTRLKSLSVTYPLVYRILYDKSNPISVSDDDLLEIKQFTSSIALPSKLVEPLDPTSFFLSKPSTIVQRAHSQNLTVYYYFLRNEYIALPFDYKADPVFQIDSLVKYYNIDGLITDFPATAINYLNSQCGATSLTAGSGNFSLPLVVPGELNNQIPYYTPTPETPAPSLVVGEPPLAGPVPVSGPPSAPLAPVPAPPSASPPAVTCLLSTTLLSIAFHLLVIVHDWNQLALF